MRVNKDFTYPAIMLIGACLSSCVELKVEPDAARGRLGHTYGYTKS